MSGKRNGRALTRGVALAACLAFSADARATLIFSTGQIPGAVNINLVSATGVATVIGATNQTVNGSPVGVTFGDAGGNLDAANGTASITAADGVAATFTTLTTTFQSGFGVEVLNFNLNRGAAAGTVTLTGFDQFGGSFTSSAFTLGPGQNPFVVTAIDGQLLTRLVLNSTAPLNTAGQFAVSGVSAIAAVPEPSTLALGGIGLVGLALGYVRQRRGRIA